MIFIKNKMIDFSKVQIYIYDLDLIEKMTKDFNELGCDNRADYLRFIIDEYFKNKESTSTNESVSINTLNTINDNVLTILNKIKDYVKALSDNINKANSREQTMSKNIEETIKLLALIYNLGFANYSKGILSKGVTLSDLLKDR